MEEEENGYALDEKELNIFYEVLFKRIMNIMEDPDVDVNPFENMIKILSRLSEIFSFKSMITVIPALIAYSIKYGIMVEKAYDEDLTNLKEDQQGYGQEEENERKRDVIQKDLDKLNMYL
ncbi:MAG: hypothetical protein EAX91_09965 [Candidatus Lokiarchaeota archaeon]|nr:hypothetical protein [Candidatus Lokiarchaeota archaeon]